MEVEQMKEGIRSIIRSEMKVKNISMVQLSRKAGVCPATVTAYLNNQRDCYLHTVISLLNAVGYELNVVPK